jgi:cyclo(L-tyrosyl-L-tyrosyl) synthase
MRIAGWINTTREEVEARRHHVWLGISLGNRYFSPEHVGGYIRWALAHTKERVLVVIGDALQAINIEILDSRTPHHAMKRAMTLGDRRHAEVSGLVAALPEAERARVRVAHFAEVTGAPAYRQNLAAIEEAYRGHAGFRAHVQAMVRAGRPDHADKIARLPEERLDRLAEYILHELPLYVDGAEAEGEAEAFTLSLYPAHTAIDDLVTGLHDGTLFPDLAARLRLDRPIAMLEAYVD